MLFQAFFETLWPRQSRYCSSALSTPHSAFLKLVFNSHEASAGAETFEAALRTSWMILQTSEDFRWILESSFGQVFGEVQQQLPWRSLVLGEAAAQTQAQRPARFRSDSPGVETGERGLNRRRTVLTGLHASWEV